MLIAVASSLYQVPRNTEVCDLSNHKKRFARWQKKLPKYTAFLVDQILTRIVPEFEARGFVWYADYAGGMGKRILHNEIPLQRREGADWPTVEIQLDKWRPWFAINFAWLPPICKDLTEAGLSDIPREEASVTNAPARFSLCRGQKRSLDCEFGYRSFRLFPRRYLRKEVDTVLALLPHLFEVLSSEMPADWLKGTEDGRVVGHFRRSWVTWELMEERERKLQQASASE